VHGLLERTAFRTSRLLDFFSIKELTAQIGHKAEDWPLVAVKELIDNALDGCEDAGTPPRITVNVDGTGITVTDNGPGIPPDTVARIKDYHVRVSSREAYVSPCRGAQGNALKTMLAMPYVLDGKQGTIEISSLGIKHTFVVKVDQLRQQPIIDHRQEESSIETGTMVHIEWPDKACLILTNAKAHFLQIVGDFAFLNPHLDLSVSWFEGRNHYPALDPAWKKWLPSNPTSAHWYDLERFKRLLAAHVSHDADIGRQRTVREFIADFDGLAGTAKQTAVLDQVGLKRSPLAVLVADDQIDSVSAETLLEAMKQHSKPVKPQRLGLIGKEAIRRRFEGSGCKPESFTYKKRLGETDGDGIPWVLETVFGYCPDAEERRLIVGVNWSPGIGNPFRELGKDGISCDALLERLRARSHKPIIALVHIAIARAQYTDRGKSTVVIDGAGDDSYLQEEDY
jgi:DNA topoisomerase VI subunit B